LQHISQLASRKPNKQIEKVENFESDCKIILKYLSESVKMANMNNLGVGGMTEWQTDAFRTSMVRKLEEAIKVTRHLTAGPSWQIISQ
jgi:hypothetical protein